MRYPEILSKSTIVYIGVYYDEHAHLLYYCYNYIILLFKRSPKTYSKQSLLCK